MRFMAKPGVGRGEELEITCVFEAEARQKLFKRRGFVVFKRQTRGFDCDAIALQCGPEHREVEHDNQQRLHGAS